MNSETKRYWDSEYYKRKWIYGNQPSMLAKNINKFIKCKLSKKILDIGGGYGKDVVYYAQNGFIPTCIDLSNIAIQQGKELANKYNVHINFLVGDFLKKEITYDSFNVIVSYHVLYLFSQTYLSKISKKIFNLLRKGGITAHMVFSKEEPTYGKGKEVEENSYLWEDGKVVHYFDKFELEKLFNKFIILELKKVDVKENHGKPHVHKDWFVLARKD